MRNLRLLGAAIVLAIGGACASTDQGDIPADALLHDEAFVPISKPSDPAAAALRASTPGLYANPINQHGNGNDFYLAISKKELGKEWFLSGYMRQSYPLPIDTGAARSLGTRVVSFKVQNGKLYVFDVAKNKQTSDLFDPQVLVEAYPIVKGYAPFEGLSNSSEYVLFDPSAGLNKFSLGNENYYDWWQSSAGDNPFTIGLSFLQGFRRISDGVTFEQVWTGRGTVQFSTGVYEVRMSGALGIALRRYKEGDGFQSKPFAGFYFPSDWLTLPDGGGDIVTSAHWNIKRGMRPITWRITRDILKFQELFPDAKVVDAVKAGVENWNQVFGFKAFEAVLADAKDDFAEDDKNFIVVDRDPSAGYAFANWRTNPNTGEIRGATVYLGGVWFDDSSFEDDEEDKPTDPEQLVNRDESVNPERPRVTWGGLRDDSLCVYAAPKGRARKEWQQFRAANPAIDALTKDQKFEAFLTHVVLHEIGHTLGLRHNFMGSLSNNSVMDYLDNYDSIARATPGEYDTAAVKYLYGLSDRPPTQMFCTDQHVTLDPDCALFDFGADPLKEMWQPYYEYISELVIEFMPIFGWDFLAGILDPYLDGVLGYARAAYDEAIALDAYEIAMKPARAPIATEDLAKPGYAEYADGLARHALKRLYLDPEAVRGYISNDPMYPSVIAASMRDLGDNLKDSDGHRSFATRRVVVDILKKMQSQDAFNLLREARAAIAAKKALGGMTVDEAALTDDLLARIDRATSPYFEN
jgi:hypothetical protein